MRRSRNATGRSGHDGAVASETQTLVDTDRAFVLTSDRQDDALDALPQEIAYDGWQCVSYWVNV